MSCFALLPAAGRGSRVSRGVPKQYLPLNGRPMLWHAIHAVCVPPVETVFVVLSPEDTHFAANDWSAFAGRLEPLYCGGATRHDSVQNGLVAALEAIDVADWMLVHDAARPCLPRADLERLIAECSEDQVGGTLAWPVADTVKRALPGAVPRIAATESREGLWLAQTPQMFRASLLLEALQSARQAAAVVTDEAGAIERLGLQPRLVAGSRDNIKVTYPEDIAIAESILYRLRRQ